MEQFFVPLDCFIPIRREKIPEFYTTFSRNDSFDRAISNKYTKNIQAIENFGPK
jgi:hypothetical protein